MTVGVIPIVDVAPIYLGVKQGFFDDEGLDVSMETAQGGAAIVPAVVSGQYQFGFSSTTTIDNVVEKAGGDPSTISYVELPFPDIDVAVARVTSTPGRSSSRS